MLPTSLRTLRALAATSIALCLTLPLALQAQSSAVGVQGESSSGLHALVPNRLTQPIVESVHQSLGQTVHPLANAANDRGAAPEGMTLDRVQIVLKRSPAQEAALHQLINDMHTPGTASYHKWLTPDAFGQQFGPSDSDIATLQGWLQSHGFGNFKLAPGKQMLEMSGSVGQLRDTFHTQIRKYEVNGATHFANATDAQIPTALAPVFGGFASLNNFHIKSHSQLLGTATYNPATDKATPSWTIGSQANGENFVLSPGDYDVQYDLNPLYNAGTNGTGETIAIINEANIDLSLVAAFRNLFNLPVNPPQVIIDGTDPGVDGINNPDGPNYASTEAYLDVEWSGAVAPKAQIDLVIGADTALSSGLFLGLEHAIYGNIAPVVSISFGLCESQLGSENQTLNSLMEQAAAQGITVLVSTGDSGSAGCDGSGAQYATQGLAVSGFASTPYNVAVGGTDFYYSTYNQSNSVISNQLATYWNTNPSNATPTVSILGVIPEQPWNDSQYGLVLGGFAAGNGTTIAAGSGGASSCEASTGTYPNIVCKSGYTKPSWQTGNGVPADKVRDIPDVSLFAANGANASYYPICASDGDCQPVSGAGQVQISGVGGTSASTPSFAGMMALVNQKYGRQGQADFVLYPLAAQFPTAFHSVTNGTNTVPCNINITSNKYPPLDCIAVANPVAGNDPNYGTATEGEIGTGTTPEYNATGGYNLATGLGTVDANVMVTNWGSVKLATSATTFAISQASFTHGTTVTVSGAVTGATTPTGEVALMTDSLEPLQQGQTNFALTAGAYSGTVNFLPGGTYNVFGMYSGDGSNASGVSNKTSITVTPEASSIIFALRSSGKAAVSAGSTVPYGTQILLSAQPVPTTYYTTCVGVSPQPASCSTASYGTATGSVAFSDTGAALAPTPLNAAGEASYNGAFAVGTHSVAANYTGDNSYNASTAAPIAFTVAKATPTIMYSSTAATSTANTYQGGQAAVFTIQVENQTNLANAPNGGQVFSPISAPTGTVTISSTPAGVSVSSSLQPAVDPNNDALEGVAALTAPSSIPAGTYTLTINYSGDANYAAASQTVTVTLLAPTSGLVASSTTLSSSATATSSSAQVLVTATVTGQTGKGLPTGTVDFSTSGINLGTLKLGTGTLDVVSVTGGLNSAILLQGANVLTVQYSGDGVYLPSASTVTLTSGPIAPPVPFTLQGVAIAGITAGASGTSVITITPTPNANFTGSIALSCAVVSGPPSGTGMPTCTIASPAVITAATSATATLTVNTTAGTAAALHNPFERLFPIGGAIAVAGLLFFGLPTRRRGWKPLLGFVLFAALLGSIAGCGGGAASAPATPPPTSNSNGATTAGTYTVNVIGTSGNSTETTSVTVNVN